MIQFNTAIKRFGSRGEKTGWYYIVVTQQLADILKPGCKKSFRVKGKLSHVKIEKISLLPMGGGDFIMALNATIRKALGKNVGEIISVEIEEDTNLPTLNKEFMECLEDEPVALNFFNSLPNGHRNYFSKWIESAKTNETRVKRIAESVTALAGKLGYGEMIRMNKKKSF